LNHNEKCCFKLDLTVIYPDQRLETAICVLQSRLFISPGRVREEKSAFPNTVAEHNG